MDEGFGMKPAPTEDVRRRRGTVRIAFGPIKSYGQSANCETEANNGGLVSGGTAVLDSRAIR